MVIHEDSQTHQPQNMKAGILNYPTYFETKAQVAATFGQYILSSLKVVDIERKLARHFQMDFHSIMHPYIRRPL